MISIITHHGCIWHGLSTIMVGSRVRGFVHLVVMKKKYEYSKQLFVNKSKPILELDLILSLVALDMQASLFKLTM
jgi:hypothetical protein